MTHGRWVKLVKEKRDEQWSMQELVGALCNRRYSERTIVYVESHDQSIVGDQTLGAPMTALAATNPRAERSSPCNAGVMDC